MKTFINKKIAKKLIIILTSIIALICITPKIVCAATDTDDGGPILKAIEEFIVYLCDNVMQWLQESFVSLDQIDQGSGTYNFQYSPAIIFSGTVPALDVNFIDPGDSMSDAKVEEVTRHRYKLKYDERENHPKEIRYKYSNDTKDKIKNDVETINTELSNWSYALYIIRTDTITHTNR